LPETMPTRDDNASRAFPATRWTLVGRAGQAERTAALSALDELLRLYLPALRNYLVRRMGIPADRASAIKYE